MPDKTQEEYLAIGEKIKAAEFRGVVITKLEYIENTLIKLGKTDKDHITRIENLEKFQANMTGKFAVIGAVVIVIVNCVWDLASNLIKSIKPN